MLSRVLRSSVPAVRRCAAIRTFASYPPHEVVGLPGTLQLQSLSLLSAMDQRI